MDQVVGELFGGDVQNAQTILLRYVADGVQQVGFTQPNAAIQEQRVIRSGGALGNRH